MTMRAKKNKVRHFVCAVRSGMRDMDVKSDHGTEQQALTEARKLADKAPNRFIEFIVVKGYKANPNFEPMVPKPVEGVMEGQALRAQAIPYFSQPDARACDKFHIGPELGRCSKCDQYDFQHGLCQSYKSRLQHGSCEHCGRSYENHARAVTEGR